MLADRFHCYKLILIVIVTSVAVFYTSLLHIDARISAEGPAVVGIGFRNSRRNLLQPHGRRPALRELLVRRQQQHQQQSPEMWTPSQCRPMD
jgi:hypothetical protein